MTLGIDGLHTGIGLDDSNPTVVGDGVLSSGCRASGRCLALSSEKNQWSCQKLEQHNFRAAAVFLKFEVQTVGEKRRKKRKIKRKKEKKKRKKEKNCKGSVAAIGADQAERATFEILQT